MPIVAPVVYVVDDDAAVRTSIGRLLTSVGLRSEIYGTADEFIRRVTPDHTGCVVVDMRMPGMSGLDLQATLQLAGVSLPVIFVTGFSDVPAVVRAMKGGAFDILTKPFGGQELLDVVQRAIERDEQRRAEHSLRGILRARYETLTTREREVMALVVSGKLNREAADETGTSEKTIKAHRAQVMRKMRADSLPELVRMADKLK